MKKDKSDYIIYCDGFIKQDKQYNPGCSVAVLIDDKKVFLKKYFVNKDSNASVMFRFYEKEMIVMEAEYYAIFTALRIWHKNYQKKKVIIYSDSEVVVKQLNNYYKIHAKHLKMWHKLCRRKMTKNVKILWIARRANVKILGH